MTKAVLLGEIAELKKDQFKPTSSEGRNYIGLEHINQQSLSLNGVGNSNGLASTKFRFNSGDILFGKLRPYFRKLYRPNFSGVCSTDIWVIRPKSGIDADFLYYLLASNRFIKLASGGSAGTRMPRADWSQLRNSEWLIPNFNEQVRIGQLLRTLDQKIELNRRMNETLEKIGQTLFKHYFIDNPDRKNWEAGKLGDIIINFDSKRVPLSSRERSARIGPYRYFGATSVMDYIDDHIFDGKFILFAEDGSVIREDGTPYLQYVWGKFWVNNHAHVLQAKKPFSVEYIYLLLKQTNVQQLISGAVQLKINQRAMNNLPILLPPNELIVKFNSSVGPMFSAFMKNYEQTQSLTNLRDSLLPRLISGTTRV